MVSSAMRRYKNRTDKQKELIGDGCYEGIIKPTEIFNRESKLRLEIGFGHGEFLSNMATVHPEEDFIGIEQKGIRTTKTAHKGNKLNANNIMLFTGEAQDLVSTILPENAFHRAYILFPDPWPKPGHRRRRLVDRAFLETLWEIMEPGGKFIFASDTHNYSMQVLSNASAMPGKWKNCYPEGYRINIPTRFPTVFEKHKKSEGCTICYLMLEAVKT